MRLALLLCLCLSIIALSDSVYAQEAPRFGVVRAPGDKIGDIRVRTSSRTLTLTVDGDAPAMKGDSLQSGLFQLPATGSVTLEPAGAGRLIVIEPGISPQIPKRYARTAQELSCSAPVGVPQSVWRDGLPAPTVLPDTNVVKHLIVHHAASDNSVTDYVAAMRAIYILHTQTNNPPYDDIGYNYIIAPDGTLFLGRDPQGRCRQDNVKGAHMCAKNTATMGVCLIGDFTTITPTAAALHTLYALLGWKLAVENLTADETSLHPPADPNAILLATIVGHQDGCGGRTYTECPGDAFYPMMGQVRAASNSVHAACIATTASVQAGRFSPLTVSAEGQGAMQMAKGPAASAWTLYNVEGRRIAAGHLDAQGAGRASGLRPGLYILRVEDVESRRVLVR